VLAFAAAACGGSGGSGPATKGAWMAKYGPKVTTVGSALDGTQAATMAGEPVGIRTSCETLRDAVQDAQATPRVPDAKAEFAFRTALDAISTGVSDCVQAMASGDARRLERSITELKAARLQLDTANAALSA
jgi:hypothetical protein